MKRVIAGLLILAWAGFGYFVACSDQSALTAKAPTTIVTQAPVAAPEPATPVPAAEPTKPVAKPEPIATAPAEATKKPEPAKPEAAAVAPKSGDEIAALILASEETVLSAQMAGRIRHINVGLGDEAKSGATLLEFDCDEQRAQLEAADADYRSARETHVARLKLQALGAAGELEVTVAAAAADKARSQVTLRRSQVAYCSVASPFRSRVARLRVKGAESVQAGQPLMDLVNASSLKAQIFVPAAWVTWLQPGAPVSILANNGRTYAARVSKLNSRVDGVSQQLEIEARIEQGEGLVPGMIGVASFNPPPSR